MFATAEGKQVYDAEWELVCRKDSATANVSKTTTSSLTARSGECATRGRSCIWMEREEERNKDRRKGGCVLEMEKQAGARMAPILSSSPFSFSIQTRHRENCFSNLELELEVVAVVALNK